MRRDSWQRALVTGASEGIGEAFARELATRGSDLVVVARRESVLEALAGELTARYGVEVEPLSADLTAPAGLAAVEERLEAAERSIDLLVNNAGGASQQRPFLELDRDLLEQDTHLNSLSLLRLTHAGARAMAERDGGNVINVSAGVAFYPLPGAAAYGAAKAFVNSLSEAVDYELRSSGVQVTAVCPGFTRTRAQQRLGLRVESLPERLWSEPEEVALQALRAASRGRAVSSLTRVGALNALAGRYLPRRLWLPGVARMQRRLAGA